MTSTGQRFAPGRAASTWPDPTRPPRTRCHTARLAPARAHTSYRFAGQPDERLGPDLRQAGEGLDPHRGPGREGERGHDEHHPAAHHERPRAGDDVADVEDHGFGLGKIEVILEEQDGFFSNGKIGMPDPSGFLDFITAADVGVADVVLVMVGVPKPALDGERRDPKRNRN